MTQDQIDSVVLVLDLSGWTILGPDQHSRQKASADRAICVIEAVKAIKEVGYTLKMLDTGTYTIEELVYGSSALDLDKMLDELHLFEHFSNEG